MFKNVCLSIVLLFPRLVAYGEKLLEGPDTNSRRSHFRCPGDTLPQGFVDQTKEALDSHISEHVSIMTAHLESLLAGQQNLLDELLLSLNLEKQKLLDHKAREFAAKLYFSAKNHIIPSSSINGFADKNWHKPTLHAAEQFIKNPPAGKRAKGQKGITWNSMWQT